MDKSLFLAAVTFVCMLYFAFRTSKQLRGVRSGHTAVAECVRVQLDQRPSEYQTTTKWVHSFVFPTADGGQARFAHSYPRQRFREGARVTVRYDPADPGGTVTMSDSSRKVLTGALKTQLVMAVLLVAFLAGFPFQFFG